MQEAIAVSDTVRFTVNGEPRCWQGEPMARLLDVLRYELGLTGTKEGCGEGECGACTVLLDGEPVCACLVPMLQCEGRAVQTIEGLGGADRLEPVQRAFVEAGGVQCGACTPGLVLTAWALLQREPRPDRARMREALAGNLCRCTGYERILRALEHTIAARQGGGAPAAGTGEATP
ncbi:MAG: carbon-monoxide dehydrogenase small subunit [Planctomycetota bacterium]|nr:MAG: carbon-monoxide dehydrogenase small subunit [Planctomycetota bacterium]